MKLTFYGVRGSIPTPGKNTIEYGGNTTCLEIISRTGDEYIIDAGSGIRELGNTLMTRQQGKVRAKLFVTHDHWDHIQGFPFFTPAYVPGCTVDVYSGYKSAIRQLTRQQKSAVIDLESVVESGNTAVFNKSSASNHTKEVFNGQQDVERGYFPIGIESMGSELTFHDLKQYEIVSNGLEVSYMHHSAHPGGMFSYQFSELGKRIVFTGDYEHDGPSTHIFGSNDEKMIAWARNADVFVIDAQYTPEEYEKRKGWGHSQIERACHLAAAANVKRLYITHHDPTHGDDALKSMEERARWYVRDILNASMSVVFAREGKSIEL